MTSEFSQTSKLPVDAFAVLSL